jgi:ATP/maltotriose-dependent transcriptional regulator MalT
MAEGAESIPVISAKLYRPPITRDHVDRQRSINSLEDGRHLPPISMSAPAGYGRCLMNERDLIEEATTTASTHKDIKTCEVLPMS